MSLDFSLYCEIDNKEIELFETNITHNLGEMASAAGIYKCLWRAPENGFEKAGDIITLLENGLKNLKKDPEKFNKLSAPNGWGTYVQFVPWVEEVLRACRTYPSSKIYTSK